MTWRTTTGFTDLPPLPFDYRKELIGGRTPCLKGSANLRTTADQLGWWCDTSATGTQVWPSKAGRFWAVDLQSIPRTMATYPDTRFVSFRQLRDCLDAQDPATLSKLRKLPIGAAPSNGWKSYLTAEAG